MLEEKEKDLNEYKESFEKLGCIEIYFKILENGTV